VHKFKSLLNRSSGSSSKILKTLQVFVEELDRKYKTLDPRNRMPDFPMNPPIHSYNSLERGTSRRKLPSVPNPGGQPVSGAPISGQQISSHSLPRPSKQKQWREQSDSRSRDRNQEQVPIQKD
jgi:hypothetical protein